MQQKQQKYFVLTKSSPTETQSSNIAACQTITTVLKSCLGPKAFQKMILTKINTIETTNDCNNILRELDVSHPALKILFDLAKTQDSVGDGTTSVVLLCTEILAQMNPLIQEFHPVYVIKALNKALNILLTKLNTFAVNAENVPFYVNNSVETKICKIYNVPIADFALQAVKNIKKNEKIDLKNVKIEKILGNIQESEFIKGLLINKNIIHPEMRRKIENGKVYFLDCLEYKKGESQISYEFSNEEDFTNALKMEEQFIIDKVNEIKDLKVDLVLVEKGISDLALSLLQSYNITALRRFTKTELERIKKLCNTMNDIGTFKLFEYIKINDEYYCKILNDSCVVSVVLRGPSKDVLNELERNFDDAVKVARNLEQSKKVVPGGGAIEMALATALIKEPLNNKTPPIKRTLFRQRKEEVPLKCYLKNMDTLEKRVFEGVANALKVIPSLLAINCGADPLELIPLLESKQEESILYGIDGMKGVVANMKNIIMEPVIVKSQCIKSAIETVSLLLRVDGIIESK